MSDLNASLAECNTKMNKAIDVAKEDFSTIRTGRAHPAMFAKLMVDYYGTPTNITQVANVTLIDARTIGVQPWEKKMLGAIEKAIRESVFLGDSFSRYGLRDHRSKGTEIIGETH